MSAARKSYTEYVPNFKANMSHSFNAMDNGAPSSIFPQNSSRTESELQTYLADTYSYYSSIVSPNHIQYLLQM
jgi:hypothetical protein